METWGRGMGNSEVDVLDERRIRENRLKENREKT